MARARGRSRIGKGGKGAAKAKKKAVKIPKRKAVKIDNAVPAICSECFGDFNLSTQPEGDKITCPVCGHVGLFEDETFSAISEQRQTHKKQFLIALIVNALALVAVLAWAVMNTWIGMDRFQPDDNTNMITLGLAFVLVIAGFFVISKYERSRVEVYF